MRENNVPEWYIQSCLKIKYMFRKPVRQPMFNGVACCLVLKVHKLLLYYCAYFSVRAQDFDIVAMSQGKEMIKKRMKEIRERNEASTKKNKTC